MEKEIGRPLSRGVFRPNMRRRKPRLDPKTNGLSAGAVARGRRYGAFPALFKETATLRGGPPDALFVLNRRCGPKPSPRSPSRCRADTANARPFRPAAWRIRRCPIRGTAGDSETGEHRGRPARTYQPAGRSFRPARRGGDDKCRAFLDATSETVERPRARTVCTGVNAACRGRISPASAPRMMRSFTDREPNAPSPASNRSRTSIVEFDAEFHRA